MKHYTSDELKELKLKYLTNSVEKLYTIATPPEKKQKRILFCELYIDEGKQFVLTTVVFLCKDVYHITCYTKTHKLKIKNKTY